MVEDDQRPDDEAERVEPAAAGDARWAGLHRRGVAADHGRSLVRNGARNGYQRGPLTSPPTRALAPAV